MDVEIGGYPMEMQMPSPQIYYPEVNGKGYEHLPSYMSNSHLLSNYYDSAYKMELQPTHDGLHKGYAPRQPVSSGPFAYRRMMHEERRRREMLAHNGLYSPRDSCRSHTDYPQYAGESNGQWNVPNGYWN